MAEHSADRLTTADQALTAAVTEVVDVESALARVKRGAALRADTPVPAGTGTTSAASTSAGPAGYRGIGPGSPRMSRGGFVEAAGGGRAGGLVGAGAFGGAMMGRDGVATAGTEQAATAGEATDQSEPQAEQHRRKVPTADLFDVSDQAAAPPVIGI